jgi:hypothetical protein
VLAPDKLPNT